LRVTAQAKNAAIFAKWLYTHRKRFSIAEIHYVGYDSVPVSADQARLLRKQMPLGGSPVFYISFETIAMARQLPKYASLFQDASSLGSVESLLDYRYKPGVSATRQVGAQDSRFPEGFGILAPTMLRISIGLEDLWDLQRDFESAIAKYQTAAEIGRAKL
jgi:cystathionine gamma-synthase